MADKTDHHEVINPMIQNISGVITTAMHPLQDVELNMDMENTNEIPTATTKSNTSRNWVKFDDEVNENVHNNNNENNSGAEGSDAGDIEGSGSKNATLASTAATAAATLAVAETTTTTAATLANKLSPIPPPAKKQHNTITNAAAATTAGATSVTSTIIARPRTPIESAQQQQQQQAVVAPVQRSTISSTSLPDVAPAVLNTESTHVNLNASGRTQQHHQPQHQKLKPSNVSATTASSSHSQQQHNNNHTHLPTSHHSSNNGTSSSAGVGAVATSSAIHKTSNVSIPIESGTPPMRTIELSTGRIREGFANGDVIVTLLPANTKWPWITPAIFRPELVPEELMAQGLTLTVEEYVNAMETLVNDYRFTVYNICYKRILVCWILFAFAVLLTLLFSGLQGVALFSLGVAWLFLNAAAIFLCMWVKLRLSRGLEKCLARVNRQLMKHKILLVLDDRGRISCHKVNLCFMYFDATPCVTFLNEFLEHTEQNGGDAIKAGWESKLDIDVNDIIIQGNNPVRLSRKQVVAQELFLSYLQRWGKDFLRRRLDWTVQEAGVHETPRHLQSSICPCQYEEEVLRNKIKIQLKGKQCCGLNCIGCWL